MKRVATVGVITGLVLSGWQASGQETDSLFVQPDSVRMPVTRLEKASQPRVVQQHATAEPFMKARVHFTSDFMKRFTDQAGANAPSGELPLRQQRLWALVDEEDSRLTQRKTQEARAYVNLVNQFVEDVCSSRTAPTLTELNEQLYAEVVALVTWQAQDQTLKLYLKKTQTKANWAWEVIGADAPFLRSITDTTYLRADHHGVGRPDSLVLVPPNAHEVNFMGLAKQLRAGNPLMTFIHATAVNDAQLLAVARSLETGQLRLQFLQTTTLWLNTQLGWLVQLRQFNRETDNSGWLISDLCPSAAASCLPSVLQSVMTKTHSLRKP